MRVLFNLLLLKKRSTILKTNVYINGVIVHNRSKSLAICETINCRLTNLKCYNIFEVCEHKNTAHHFE